MKFQVYDSSGKLKTTGAGRLIGTLAQLNPSAATLTALYTVPAGSRVRGKVIIANRSVATSFRVSVALAGAGDSVEQYLAYDKVIAGVADDEVEIHAGPTDVIRVYATLATLSFSLVSDE